MKSTTRRAESTPFLRLIADNRVEGPKDKLAARFEKRAKAFLESGRWEEALAACDRAIELEPDFAWAHADRGLALFSLGRFEEAVASGDRAIELQLKCALAHGVRGLALFRLNRFGEALAAYDHTIKLVPDFADVHCERGRTLFALGRVDEAFGALNRAIELRPDFANWHGYLGNQLLRVGRTEEALAAFDRVIELKPDFAEVHGVRGVALYNLGRYAEALAAYDRAIELKPDMVVPGQINRGDTLLKLGRYSEAVAAYDDVLEVRPDWRDVQESRQFAVEALETVRKSGEKTERFGASNTDVDLGHISSNATDTMFSASDITDAVRKLPNNELKEVLRAATAEVEKRGIGDSAPGEPRLKWDNDRLLDEDPARFAWRAYQAEAQARKLHRGVIYDEDRALYTKLNSWLRSNAMPEGVDIPTKRDWITRQIEAGRAKPAPFGQRPNTEEERLYETLRKRQSRPSPPPVQKSARHILT